MSGIVDRKDRPPSATGIRIQTFSPRPSSSSERGFLTSAGDQRDWSKPETFGLSMTAKERREELEARLQELTVPQITSADAVKDKTKVIHELIGMTKYLRRDNELVHSQLEKQVDLTEELRRENATLREEIGSLRAKASRLSSTGYVPSPDRLDELQESINEIREEIKRNDLGQMRKDIASRIGSASTMSIEEGGAYEHLLLTKFEVLEQLIVVLKKRIEVLEEMEHRMKDVANEYGSLQALIDTEKQLRKENEKLRQREVRFSTNSLLKRRKLNECDPSFLRVMILSLQSELSAARTVIDSFNLESNDSLALLVKSPSPLPIPSSLKDLDDLARTLIDSNGDPIADRKNTRFRRSSVHLLDHSSQEEDVDILKKKIERLTVQLSALEGDNVELREELESMEKRCATVARLDDIAARVGEDAIGKSMRQLSKQLNQLLEQLSESEKEVRSKSATVTFQNEVIAQLTAEKEEHAMQVQELSSKQVRSLKRIKELESGVLTQMQSCHSLYYLSLTFIHAELERASRGGATETKDAREMTNIAFRDVVDLYTKTSRACIIIQCWFRGWKARKALRTDRGFISGRVKRLSQQRAAQKAVAKSGDDGLGSIKLNTGMSLVESLHALYRAIALAGVRTDDVSRFTDVLRDLKKEIAEDIKKDVQRFLDESFVTMQEEAVRMMEGMKFAFNFPRIERSTQTGLHGGKDKSTMVKPETCDVELDPIEVEEPKGKKK